MNKTLIAGLVAAATLIGGWHLVYGDGGMLMADYSENPIPGVEQNSDMLGAQASPEVFSYLRVYGSLTQGGGVTSTSTSGTTVPLLGSDFDTENVIDVTLNVSDATLSFPATTTLTGFIPHAGMTRTIYVRSATTTAAMDLTLTGGTGVLMKIASSTATGANTAVMIGDTDGGNHAKIDLLRKANTDIEAFVTVFRD